MIKAVLKSANSLYNSNNVSNIHLASLRCTAGILSQWLHQILVNRNKKKPWKDRMKKNDLLPVIDEKWW